MVLLLAALILLLAACGSDEGSGTGGVEEPSSTLLDLSGLAWLGGDEFVGVHDAKNPDELDRPRVSILTLVSDPEGTLFRTVDIDWPEPLGASSDLESVAAIPGTSDLLFAESGDDGDPDFHRIFLATWDGESLVVVDYASWPVNVFNVEAIAVAAVGSGYVFVFAERAQGMPSTQIQWAAFDPETFTFGSFSSVTFDADIDNGPFRSSVYLAGRLVDEGNGPQLILDEEPAVVGHVDGFKTESVTVRRDRRCSGELHRYGRREPGQRPASTPLRVLLAPPSVPSAGSTIPSAAGRSRERRRRGRSRAARRWPHFTAGRV